MSETGEEVDVQTVKEDPTVEEDGSAKQDIEEGAAKSGDEGLAGEEAGKEEGVEGGQGDESGRDGRAELQSQVATLSAQVQALTEKLGSRPASEERPRERTEGEWEALTTKTGWSKEAHQYFESGLANLARLVMSQIGGLRAGSAKDQIINKLGRSKEYADIRSLRDDIDEFLELFDVSLHGREDLIKSAYLYAKGKNSGKAGKKAMDDRRVGVKIATSARPASSKAAGNGGSKKVYKLTETERQAYNTFGKKLFKNEEEYARSLPRFRGK